VALYDEEPLAQEQLDFAPKPQTGYPRSADQSFPPPTPNQGSAPPPRTGGGYPPSPGYGYPSADTAWNHPQTSGQQGYPPSPYTASPVKKRGLPLFVKALIGLAGVGIVAIAVLAAVLWSTLNSAKTADYYKIVDDQVPSVKKALGEERKVTGVSSSVSGGIHTKIFDYEEASGQNSDMSEYADYLIEKDDFAFITDHDFGPAKGKEIQLAKESVDDGMIVVMQIDYDRSGYTITLMHGEGEIAAKETDEPEPTAEPMPTAAPAPTENAGGISAEGANSPNNPEKTDAPLKDADLEPKAYIVDGESIPSITAMLGEARTVANEADGSLNGGSSVSVEYSVPGSGQGLELYQYALYLQSEEEFIFTTDADFNQPSGTGVQMAKESGKTGFILIVELDWDESGYTITTSRLIGTITRYDEGGGGQPAQQSPSPQASGELPPLLSLMGTGTYSFNFTMVSDGMQVKGILTQQKKLYAMRMELDVGGMPMTSTVVVRDGYSYSFDSISKTVVRTVAGEGDGATDFSGYAVLGEGAGELDGETLPYIEYGNPEEVPDTRYYIKNGDVVAIASGDTVMRVSGATGEAMPELFVIPQDYDMQEG
jgi:hypothetical protein